MNISVNIKEIIGVISPEDAFIYVAGLSLFGYWLYRTSFGRKALEDSVPRRNNMPLVLPLVLIFGILLAIGLLSVLSLSLSKNLAEWQQIFIGQVVVAIGGIFSIVLLLRIIKIYFVRGIKGFGLNIKTIPRDLGTAFLYLLAILPIMDIAFYGIQAFNKLIYGPKYKIPTHVELQFIVENPNIAVRIAIAISVIVVTPVLEEMLFRGLFQTAIRSALNTKYAAWIAIFVTSVFFAISHANASHWPVLFILSSTIGYSYEKSGSLFRPIFIHAFFNATAVIATWTQ